MKKPSRSDRPRGRRAASVPPGDSKQRAGGPAFGDEPAFALLQAEPSWETVDFISDLHLRPEEPDTFLAWQHYMRHTAAQAVFILGDLFETWVGDDLVAFPLAPETSGDGFEQRCARILLRATAQRRVFFMHGNRDFLLGETFARACGVQLLQDPSILSFAGQRWLLSHGDALCLADTDYMKFRALVRNPQWQQEFLHQPLELRRAVARDMRQRSDAHQIATARLVDADAQMAAQWLAAADAHCLIHGHTHRPAEHALGAGLKRIVLSDWDMGASPARSEVLRIDAAQGQAPARVRRVASALA